MKDQIEYKGASGAAYRFRLAENGDPKTTISGNFIYVREGETPATVIFVGAANNLAVGVRERWDEAVREYGATHIYTRLNVANAARTQELEDLVAGLQPAMNTAPAN